MILHALYKARTMAAPPRCRPSMRCWPTRNRDIGELWMEMATYGHVDGQNHPRHRLGGPRHDGSARGRSRIGAVHGKSYLALYRDPVVARNVSRSDFRIKQLMHEDDPVSLYIVTQPNDKARLRPLWCASW